ncbi:MAG: pyruvate formate lyase family protein, partial [Clostridia bacterium]|nr:pyruvate formate lyase family protein [Clostridia bacterium]
MNYDFQSMKAIIAREFDEVMEHYPTDMTMVSERVPVGGDPLERKLTIVRAAVELCPVHLFDHYPYAFEIDGGGDRGYCHYGVGWLHQEKSGVDFGPLQQITDELREKLLAHIGYYTDQLHRTMDYDKLLAVGFKGVYEECERYNQTETDPEKKKYREGVMEICLLVKRLGERFKKLAVERLADPGLDEDTIHNMTRIRDSVNTPWDAPVTLFDACNSLLCAALFMAMLDGLGMHAQGPIDRLLYPFYKSDLESGRISPEEGRFLIACFLYKTDAHAHYTEERQTFDNGVTVMIGGCDPQGNPVYNEVTDIVIDTYLQNKLIHPKLNARAGSYSPKSYLLRLAEVIRSGNNNIIVENDDYIVPMFQRMGLAPEDARTYVGVGCEEVICRNQLHSRAFIYLNMPLVLLDTLQGNRRDIYREGAFDKGDFETLYRSFLQNLRNYAITLTGALAPYEAMHDKIKLEPIQSAFTADCMARGLDICQGGARYQHKTLSLVGFGTLVDSLLALRDAYREGTLPELMLALENDFVGYEVLQAKIRNGKNRFGHCAPADDFAEKVAEDLSVLSRGIYNGQGIEWHTSLFTYYFFHTWRETPATPDGRRKGEDLSRQMN